MTLEEQLNDLVKQSEEITAQWKMINSVARPEEIESQRTNAVQEFCQQGSFTVHPRTQGTIPFAKIVWFDGGFVLDTDQSGTSLEEFANTMGYFAQQFQISGEKPGADTQLKTVESGSTAEYDEDMYQEIERYPTARAFEE